MINNSVIVLFILFSAQLTAQNISGKIINADTKELLSYVNVGVVGTTHGTVSDLSGKFELTLSSTLSSTDAIRFSSIGYETKTMTIEVVSAQVPIIVELQPIYIGLPEVVVRQPFGNQKIIGHQKTTKNTITNLAINNRTSQNLGAEIGRLFKVKQSAYIEQFRFYVAQNNFDTVHFRINVYDIKKGKPNKNIMPENLIIKAINRQVGWIEVDLSRYQIKIEYNFIASVEWVYAGGKGNRLGFPISIPSIGATHFYKYGSQNNWKRFSQMSSAMEVTLGW